MKMLSVLLLALLPALQAGSHPCDAKPEGRYRARQGRAFDVGWCHAGAAEWRIYVSGVRIGTVVETGTANAAGLRYSRFTWLQGNLTVLWFDVVPVNGAGVEGPALRIPVAIVDDDRNGPAQLPPEPPKRVAAPTSTILAPIFGRVR